MRGKLLAMNNREGMALRSRVEALLAQAFQDPLVMARYNEVSVFSFG